MIRIVKKDDEESVEVCILVKLSRNMLECEENIQSALNAAGRELTAEALKRFDADGSPIMVAGEKLTAKKPEEKEFKTPYGDIRIARYVYQSSRGGKTYIPLEKNACTLKATTPRFAKLLSSRYAEMNGAARVMEDLEEHHGVHVSKGYVQQVADMVSAIVEIKEEKWEYALPEFERPPASISMGIDGTTMLMTMDGTNGYRETMVGTIAFHDAEGERMHTLYVAAAPEYGKERFFARMTREIVNVKREYPGLRCTGIADGASSNWEFLTQHTDVQILDFFHSTEYLTKVADVVFGGNEEARKEWLDDACHRLKHEHGAPKKLIEEMKGFSEARMRRAEREIVRRSITYFENHKHQMIYAWALGRKLPIGSGVTEAACKVLVKQRMCNSGMRWKQDGAATVLRLRSLRYSKKWDQFWRKLIQYGVPEFY